MGNIEKPLTWGLAIVLLGYLFIANCKCGKNTTCPLNNGFNITNAGINVKAFKFDALTVDDVIEAWNNKSDKDITEVTVEGGDTMAVETSSGDETDLSEDENKE